MKELKEYFKPYQPSIDHSLRTDVVYQEYRPSSLLTPYIHCYWNLRSLRELDASFMYRVVSDGCIDILYEQENKDLYITGFSSRFIEYDLSKSFNYVGVRFLPTGFPCLFEISASTLTDNFLPLAEVVPGFHNEMKNLTKEHFELSTIANHFDQLFTQQLNSHEIVPIPDPRFLNAFNQILKSRGSIKLSDLDIAVSERQLRRLFDYYFGESPKTFSKVLRFQNILGAKPTPESLKNNKIFYDEGYYDQAHFIKEFKEFYGVTPGKAFGY